VVRLPYFVLGPGPARDVESLIHVQGHATYQSRGHLLLTSVSFYQPNVYEVIGAWISSSETVVPERDILGPGQTQQQETQQALSQMDTSKIDAAIVALSHYAGYPKSHGKGVLVENVLDNTPAAGKLFAGDLIIGVNGANVSGVDQVSRAIRSAGVGHPVRFTVQAGGKTREVSVAPIMVPKVSYPVIGVSLVANFPFPISIDSGGIGGPSAGLMWTLGLVDILTPGDLTGGRTIAGTGTISTDGTVGPIGGIEQKVVAAERAGAKLFFAPADEAAAARAVAHGLVIVSVKSYQDAVNYLEQRP
jgi:PDZ domain-containing protein